ncbi:MAG TPA: hypothetical protein VHL09_01220 [Dehalococcoidia bacterium]|nr:hypothetical protein [Dehalococcoidia bacterium]
MDGFATDLFGAPADRRRFGKWLQVVEGLGLDLEQPVSMVSGADVKRLAAEEPRLMAKIDHEEDLPDLFRQRGIFILPTSNRDYALIQGRGYHALEPPAGPPRAFYSRLPFILATAGTGKSEMQHLDYAFNCGLIEEFAGVGSLYLTIRGRRFSPEFSFRVGDSPQLTARSVQVEVDAGLEAQNHILVIEAKIGVPRTFHIRQLYYPFRFWQALVPEKTILPIFFCFDDRSGLYHFWLYRFRDPSDYASIELIRQTSFAIVHEPDPALRPEDLPRSAPPARREVVPQADDLAKLIELPFRVAEGVTTAQALADCFGIQPRQGRYYREAAETLGLVQRDPEERYHLTDLGLQFIALPADRRHVFLCRLIFALPVIQAVLAELLLKPVHRLSRAEIEAIITAQSHLSGTTVGRRAQTLLAWFRWVQHTTGVVRVEDTYLTLPGPRLL